MRRFYTPLALLCFFMLASYLTVNAQEEKISETVFATDDGSGVRLSLTKARTIQAFEDEFGDGTVISDVWIEQGRSASEGPYYLVATGSARGNSRTMAVVLVNVDGVYHAGKIRHTCTGAPCSSCEFTYDEDDNIDGCNCNIDPPAQGLCNHSITEGSLQVNAGGGPYGIGFEK